MKKGDKYIIEIDEVIDTNNGPIARIKGFNSLVFDETGLGKLRQYHHIDTKGHNDYGIDAAFIASEVIKDLKRDKNYTIHVTIDNNLHNLKITLYNIYHEKLSSYDIHFRFIIVEDIMGILQKIYAVGCGLDCEITYNIHIRPEDSKDSDSFDMYYKLHNFSIVSDVTIDYLKDYLEK